MAWFSALWCWCMCCCGLCRTRCALWWSCTARRSSCRPSRQSSARAARTSPSRYLSQCTVRHTRTTEHHVVCHLKICTVNSVIHNAYAAFHEKFAKSEFLPTAKYMWHRFHHNVVGVSSSHTSNKTTETVHASRKPSIDCIILENVHASMTRQLSILPNTVHTFWWKVFPPGHSLLFFACRTFLCNDYTHESTSIHSLSSAFSARWVFSKPAVTELYVTRESVTSPVYFMAINAYVMHCFQ